MTENVSYQWAAQALEKAGSLEQHVWERLMDKISAAIQQAYETKNIHCKECKHWNPDVEFDGLGACQNENVTDMFIIGHADMFLLSEDFGCIFSEQRKKEVEL